MNERKRARYDMRSATDRALRHIEVSSTTACSPSAFAKALRTGIVDATTRDAVALLLDEGDEQLLVDIVAQGQSSFETLAGLADQLLVRSHPTASFLKEAPQ